MNWVKWLYPGMNLKRWLLFFAVGVIFVGLGITLFFNYQFVGFIEAVVFKFLYSSTGAYYQTIVSFMGVFVVVVGVICMVLASRKIIGTVMESVMPGAKEPLRELIFTQRKLNKGPEVVVIGGGTGLSVLLRGIKHITGNCTAVVTTGDDGGSSGRLRKEMGMVPPGDMRNCLIALADTEPLMEKVLQYRFKTNTSMEGHNLGNLFIAAMTDIEGNIEDGLTAICDILKVRGHVWPSSSDDLQLKAEMEDGSIVIGESAITASKKRIKKLMTEPEAPRASQSAINAIINADAIILGPGSLYTSVIASLIIPGIKEAVINSKAVKIYVCNVMTQPGETDGFGAYEHVKTIIDHMGVQCLDYVIVNEQEASVQQIKEYEKEGASPVAPDVEKIEALGIDAVQARLLNNSNMVRHNPIKLAKTIITLIYRLRLFGRGIQYFDYFFARQTIQDLQKNINGE